MTYLRLKKNGKELNLLTLYSKFIPWLRTTWIATLSVSTIVLVLLLFETFSSRMEKKSAMYFATNFTENRDLMSLDHRNDFLWEKLSPEGVGLFSSPSTNSEEKSAGVISMFHQLHCIHSMRTALQDALAGKDIGVDWHQDHHWPHCLDYMVQTILCHADDTIENGDIIDGVVTQNISGYQETRQCKAVKDIYDVNAEGLKAWDLKFKIDPMRDN